jgi:methylmalonyl-CoA mutase cobalamin-binding domain/chain
MEQNSIDLKRSMANLEEEVVLRIINTKIKERIPPEKIIGDLQKGMVEVGNRFEKEQYFVPDLIYAGEILKESLKILKPLLKGESREQEHTVVMGTVYGDVHDLGKDVVVTLLNGNGFQVVDLGINVPPDEFVRALKESGARLLGMSALLTMSFDAISKTVQAIEEAGLREHVSIMVGGAPVTDRIRENTGCDYYGKDALEGVKIANRVYGIE